MRIQKLQAAIPKIEDLNLSDTKDLQSRLKRLKSELISYEVAIGAIIRNFETLSKEAIADCEKLEFLIDNAPATEKRERILSLRTSIIQTEQQASAALDHCKMLYEQIETIRSAKRAIVIALQQNNLANLAKLCATLKSRDAKIREP